MLDLHDIGAGRVVCHPRPDGSWPVLVVDLLRALGKHPRALARERRTGDGPALLRVWLRAEQVRHLVVLRAHRLGRGVLDRLVELAADTDIRLWPVWHDDGHLFLPYPSLDWAAAAALLHAERGTAVTAEAADVLYADAVTAGRHEARTWQPDGHRLGHQVPYWEHAWPGCDVGALLQRLTIDAATPTQLRARLDAAQVGFVAAARRLTLPEIDREDLAMLGPRLAPDTIDRLRGLVCPATAAALTLALATDADARNMASLRADRRTSGIAEVTLLAGRYRIPERARPMLRAAILAHGTPDPGQPLFAPTGRVFASVRRLAHMIGRGAALAGITPPNAARPLHGCHPASPFTPNIARHVTVTDQ